METTRALLGDQAFSARHRASPQAFTRVRALPFALVVALVMRKGVKSLQNWVNEAVGAVGGSPVSASAFSKARYRLKHTAFIELNRKAVLETLYGDGEYRRYRGWRLLGIDGSKVQLPDSATVREAFGTIAFSNGKNDAVAGERPCAMASVIYDLCNNVALDASLAHATAYEVDLAVAHLAYADPGDLVLADPTSARAARSVIPHARTPPTAVCSTTTVAGASTATEHAMAIVDGSDAGAWEPGH